MTDWELIKSDTNEYKIIKDIGKGGYGIVYMIVDTKSEKK